MAGFESRIMCGRGPDGTPLVIELDDDGYLSGVTYLVESNADLVESSESLLESNASLLDSNATLVESTTYLIHDTGHIPHFTGEIWYVATDGDDENDGDSPHVAFATIGHAADSAAAGDAITVGAGIYTEDVDMNLGGLELWGEIGATLVGTLTVSANNCRVSEMIISPVVAVGVALTGGSCRIENTHVIGTPIVGFDIDGTMNMLVHCMVSGHTVTALDVAGPSTHLYRCTAQGANAATRGFYFSNAAADICYVENCMSVGNATAGYEVVTGAVGVAFHNCLSGAGDGARIDADSASVWSNYTFDDRRYHVTTFDNTGPTNDNLFRVYGSVIVTEFSGEVATVLAADIGNGYIGLWDGANAIDVTDSPGPAFNSLPVSSFLHKVDDNTVQIAIEDSSQVRLYEDATKFGEDPHFQVTAKVGAASYIRLVYSGAGASGAIHWHCQWCPLTDDGFLEPA